MSAEPQAKKLKSEQSTLVIGTHNGTFHCDEALAVFLLRLTELYRDSPVKRSRDPAVLDACNIVVDVGGIYDDFAKRYDHHQRGFEENFGHGFVTKLSSAGLVYKHYGKQIIADRAQLPVENPVVEMVWLRIYRDFIEAIDANDNGIPRYPPEVKARYNSGGTSLPSRVAALNPRWNEKVDLQGVDNLFAKASILTGTEFLGKLDGILFSWLPARDIVLSAFHSSKSIDPSGKILVFQDFAPWKEHLFDIEEETTTQGNAIYVIYPDETGGNWRIQAVPKDLDSFESRKALPEPWRGLRDEELSKASGVPGGIFIHASGFIGGNKTKEGALEIAKRALSF
ncbi:GAMM1 protein [Flagelloscypha sp. PMI_526]|nr:GAMM1 protein [Flagelloscypha sp. PMI_526]